MKKSKPGPEWYINTNKIGVRKDLGFHPEIVEKLGYYQTKFIHWCAAQRVGYQGNIENEFNEFFEKVISKRLYNIDNKFWKKLSKFIFSRDNYTCKYCGQIGGILEVDHIVPISKDGSNDTNNLTTSCRKCNRQKKDKSVKEFSHWRNTRG